jgi:hypothetical protein
MMIILEETPTLRWYSVGVVNGAGVDEEDSGDGIRSGVLSDETCGSLAQCSFIVRSRTTTTCADSGERRLWHHYENRNEETWTLDNAAPRSGEPGRHPAPAGVLT